MSTKARTVDCVLMVSTLERTEEESESFLEFCYPRDYIKDSGILRGELVYKCATYEDLDPCDAKKPRVHHFSFQNIHGADLYASVITFYQVSTENLECFVPKFICMISRFNRSYLLEIFLKVAMLSGLNSDMDMFLDFSKYLINSLPDFPESGVTNYLSISPKAEKIPISNPYPFEPPMMTPDSNPFFEYLGSLPFTLIYSNILSEKRVVLISKKTEILLPIMETILCLIYPLKWCHLYGSLCSMDFIKSLRKYDKEPFFLGIPNSVYIEIQDEAYFKDVLIYDLDSEMAINNRDSDLFVPHRLRLDMFNCYNKSFRCLPSKKAILEFTKINLGVLFGNRERYYREENEKDRIDEFFKKLNGSLMLKRYYESINCPVLKRDSKAMKKFYSRIVSYYEKVIKESEVPLNKVSLKELPLIRFKKYEFENIYNKIYNEYFQFNKHKLNFNEMSFKQKSNVNSFKPRFRKTEALETFLKKIYKIKKSELEIDLENIHHVDPEIDSEIKTHLEFSQDEDFDEIKFDEEFLLSFSGQNYEMSNEEKKDSEPEETDMAQETKRQISLPLDLDIPKMPAETSDSSKIDPNFAMSEEYRKAVIQEARRENEKTAGKGPPEGQGVFSGEGSEANTGASINGKELHFNQVFAKLKVNVQD